MMDQVVDTVAQHDIRLISEAVSEQIKVQLYVAYTIFGLMITVIGVIAKDAWSDMKQMVKQQAEQHSKLHVQVQLISQQVYTNKNYEKIMTTLGALGSQEPLNEDE